MRISFVINRLQGGGAERNLIAMANYWAAHGNSITIISIASLDAAYEIDDRVNVVRLNDDGKSRSTILNAVVYTLQRMRKLRNALVHSRPQVIIAFNSVPSILSILTMAGSGIPVIAAERVDPSKFPIGRQWAALRHLVYRFASRITMLSAGGGEIFPASCQDRIRVIPNPVEFPVPLIPENHRPQKRIVGMGRLVYEKGFDLLITAFAMVHKEFPDWTLEIIGQGNYEPVLKALANACNVGDAVHLTGWISSPYARLQESSLFVFSSRYEGFGMALAEAMACGLPVISFDCPSGPRDIIRDGVDGILVPPEDVSALANAMRRLMGDAELCARLASRAVEVTDRFSQRRIMTMWEDVLGEIAGYPNLSMDEKLLPSLISSDTNADEQRA